MNLAQLIEIRKKLPPIDRNAVRSTLAERFLIPPFTVLDARQGYWQKRKKAWIELGIQSELGRIHDGNGLLGISQQARSHYKNTSKVFNEATLNNFDKTQNGTSIFDPVLCEIVYRWFCPKGGVVLDPFAGGSVRGIVAALTGRTYRGIDLRQEQKDANDIQGDKICWELQEQGDLCWVVGDSYDVQTLLPNNYDFIFSSPPYANLERYSDDPRDLSTMDYGEFLDRYRSIISRCCTMLKDNRFACFVVGDVRDKTTGNYYNFVGDTIQAFLDCGLHLYNEAILVTSIGSLPIRVGTMFKDYRKLGKTHQNVLVFLKGDAELACLECGDIDVDDLDMPPCTIGNIALEEEPIIVSVGMNTNVLLQCDINRVEAIQKGGNIPRTWIGKATGWERLDDLTELTYIVNDVVYLNREVFPNAPLPPVDRLPVKALRR